MLKTRRAAVASLLGAATVAAVVLASGGTARDVPERRVSALDRLPAVTVLPPAVQEWAGVQSARARGGAEAVRRLRANVGTQKSDVALVTDDVGDVGLTIDGRSYPVSVANNIAFAEYEDGNLARIAVTYADGSTETSNVRLNGPRPVPPSS